MTGKACFKNGNNLKGGNEPIHPTGNEKRIGDAVKSTNLQDRKACLMSF